jgi:hypothetical protein
MQAVPAIGECEKRLSRIEDELRQRASVGFGVFGDELDGSLEVICGRTGPDY